MKGYKDFKNKHRTEWREFLWEALAEKIVAAKSGKIAKEILDKLFSNYEKEIITKRIAALALINEGRGYKEIGEILWLSHATISAIKKNFFGNNGIYKSQRSLRLNKKERPAGNLIQKSSLKGLFNGISIWELIKNPPRPVGLGLKK